ncbi:MAG TPA: TetR/AcrR family transcriptional regulator [Mycobacteriales bacterium]|nr:TetR/AcrR family transcriptional regulator [Mycobacteriales bacterium]
MAAATGVAAPTRERIVDEAMRLFGQNGFRGTSVAQIEKAAGLSPGAGGLYHHFASKDEVLIEGVRRHLARLEALRNVRAVLGDLGDLRAELTVVARFTLAEFDAEAELFQILASEVRRRPDLLNEAADAVVSSTYDSFAEWLSQPDRADAVTPERARAVATFAMGSLLAGRLLRQVLGVDTQLDDETMIPLWVDMTMNAIGQ